jgi:hypothetical protein
VDPLGFGGRFENLRRLILWEWSWYIVSPRAILDKLVSGTFHTALYARGGAALLRTILSLLDPQQQMRPAPIFDGEV